MKSLRYINFRLQKKLRTPAVFFVTAALAGIFWLAFSTNGLAGPASANCTFCHKRSVTMTLSCASLDYQRHLDHGDTTGACMTPTANGKIEK